MAERFDVAVVGSLHLDIMVKGSRLPALDETVIGDRWDFKCGGKGCNQAVAAAKAGARTAFVGRVGDDDFGRRLLNHLDAAQVERSRTEVDPSAPSGMSVAIETAEGGYGAVIVSGANRRIGAEQLAGLEAVVLLLQNEVTTEINAVAARQLSGAYVIHNMAPFLPVDESLLAATSLVVVNRIEAEAMTGLADWAAAAEAIAGRGCEAIVTAGERGCAVAYRDGRTEIVPAPKVQVVSTHGAGDCFCGTLAAAISRGERLIDAAVLASAAAAVLVSGG